MPLARQYAAIRGSSGSTPTQPSPPASQHRAIDDPNVFARQVERYPAGAMVDQAPAADALAVIVSGWACEARSLNNGSRQIFSFKLPGDVVFLPDQDSANSVTVIAVTRLEITHPLRGGNDGAERSADLARALKEQRRQLLNHIVRLGALNASQRILHLLLELHERLSAVGLVKQDAFRIPLTQETFAEALGLSIVHVNRTLQQLRKQGLIVLRSGNVTLNDLPRLRTMAGYAAPTVG